MLASLPCPGVQWQRMQWLAQWLVPELLSLVRLVGPVGPLLPLLLSPGGALHHGAASQEGAAGEALHNVHWLILCRICELQDWQIPLFPVGAASQEGAAGGRGGAAGERGEAAAEVFCFRMPCVYSAAGASVITFNVANLF